MIWSSTERCTCWTLSCTIDFGYLVNELKYLFTNHFWVQDGSEDFMLAYGRTLDLISLRKKILSDQLPLDEVRSLRQEVMCKMDLVNRWIMEFLVEIKIIAIYVFISYLIYCKLCIVQLVIIHYSHPDVIVCVCLDYWAWTWW